MERGSGASVGGAARARGEELVPQATVVRLDGAGHVVLDDAPEAVATAVVGWLRSL
jgi:pimeloyl-ACP methyl ester carboxylesterase